MRHLLVPTLEDKASPRLPAEEQGVASSLPRLLEERRNASSQRRKTRRHLVVQRVNETSKGGSFFFHKSFFKQLRFLTTRSAREVGTRNGGVKVRGSQLLPRGLFQAVAVLDDKVGEGGQDQK
ncbi:hypothetical protein GW17_00018885 [Ensete ventricosum]|nr:hypothetical protein GW17_00018885 [Ensete ventricosum]